MAKILFRGVEYRHADEMPADVRAEYDKAVFMLPDRDANGIPDLLESTNAPPAFLNPDPKTPTPSMPNLASGRLRQSAIQGLRWLPWVISGSILLCLGVVFVFFLGIMGLIKSSEAYQLGLKTAAASPTAQEVLGAPIQDGMFVTGSVSETGSSGSADLSVELSGSSHSGTLQINASKENDTWRLIYLTLTVGDQTYNLLE